MLAHQLAPLGVPVGGVCVCFCSSNRDYFGGGKWITGQSMGSAVSFAQYVRIRIRRFDIYTYHGKLCVDCSSEMFA